MALEAHIRANDSYTPEGETRLTFELKNTGPEGLYVLTWMTPLEGIVSDCLDVRLNNELVPYDGPLVKRGTPTLDNYVFVGAGKTVTNEFDANSAYKVSLQGDYEVNLNATVPDAFPEASEKAAKACIADEKISAIAHALSCEAVRFNVKGEGAAEPTEGEKARALGKGIASESSSSEESGVGEAPLAPVFKGGTKKERDQVEDAHVAGFQLCLDAHANLGDDSKYVEWFGTFTETRLSDVTNVYNSVRFGMETYTLTYNLTGEGCKSNWYAYTYHGSHEVWICGVFWGAPAKGTDSQAETILHEQSHALGNTDDIKYGQKACRKLALDDPDKAIKNADSYAYYATSVS